MGIAPARGRPSRGGPSRGGRIHHGRSHRRSRRWHTAYHYGPYGWNYYHGAYCYSNYYSPYYYRSYGYFPFYGGLGYGYAGIYYSTWRHWWTSSWFPYYGALWYPSWYATSSYLCYDPDYIASRRYVERGGYRILDDPGTDDGAAADEPVDEAESKGSTPESLARYYVELGDLYFRTRRYLRAAEAYSRAIRLVPDDGSLRFVQADAWFATGDYDKAAYAIRQGLRLDPALAEADVDKREYYGNKADFTKQLDALRRHLKDRQFDSQARLVLAYNLRFSKALAETANELNKLAEQLPGDSSVSLLRNGLKALEAAKTPTSKKAPASKKTPKTKSGV